jgi:hypothetical protein
MEDDLDFLKKGDNLNFFENGSRPKKFKVKTMVVAPLRVT